MTLSWIVYLQTGSSLTRLSSKRALRIDEKALGLGHPYVAIDLNNVAILYIIGRGNTPKPNRLSSGPWEPRSRPWGRITHL